MWKCLNCEKQVENIEAVKCPYCGYRIFHKERPPIVRKVPTD